MDPEPGLIDERAFRFLCDVIEYVRTIKWEPGSTRIIEQLVDAAGSIGANRQEAIASSTRREFVRFNKISLRSAREATFWLRTCCAAHFGDRTLSTRLLDEAHQLAKILGAIVSRTRQGES